jgi:peptidoglycan/LPS O-acetylase OafA/YrhL
MNDHNLPRPAFRSDVEGLRGIAILLVVLYHADVPFFTGGFVGVDVFFVLSGYLITGLLVKEAENKGRIDLPNFYARRARRLLPAAALVLAFTAFASYFILSPVEQKELPKTALATAAYASNLYFARVGTDYLATGTETNPLLHTWSLSVEEQFYFVFPFLVVLAMKRGRGRLPFVMGGVAIASFALCVWLTEVRQPWAFFSSPTRAWEFATGSLGLLLAKTKFDRRFGWLGLLMVLAASFAFGKRTYFPGVAALLPVLGTILMLRAEGAGKLGGFLASGWLQFFGRLSYSWYLWHWPVLVFAHILWDAPALSVKLGCLALSLGVAWLSYRFVENPIRHARWISRRSGYSLAMAACLTLFGICVGFGWHRAIRAAEQDSEQRQFLAARSDRAAVYTDRCIAKPTDTELKRCVYGATESTQTVVLFGDSHAAHWLPAIEQVARERGWRVETLLKSACATADVSYFSLPLKRRYTECEQWRADAMSYIAKTRPAAVLVTTASSAYARQVGGDEWAAGTRRTMESLDKSGAAVIYLRDTPNPRFDVPACLSRRAWYAAKFNAVPCTYERSAALNEDLYQIERQAAEGLAGVKYTDLSELVCPEATCEPIRDGKVVFFDSHHMTATFAKSLAPALERLLPGALPE